MSTTPPTWEVCKAGIFVSVGSTGGGTWGTITGNIAAQSDLNAAFAALNSSPTFTGGVTSPSFNGSGTTPQVVGMTAGVGSITALAANSAGLSAPDSGGTAYRWKMPASTSAGIPVVGATNTSRGVLEAPITINKWLPVPTGSIGGSAITPGTPLTGTLTDTGAAVGDFCQMTPSTGSKNAAITPYCYVSATNTITWELQAQGASPVTPTAQVYNCRVN